MNIAIESVISTDHFFIIANPPTRYAPESTENQNPVHSDKPKPKSPLVVYILQV
jgi:hypothetical protein